MKTINLTESELETLFDLIAHVSGTEYLSFVDDTVTELEIPFNCDDNKRIETALNDDDFSHPYLLAVIAKRALNKQLDNK